MRQIDACINRVFKFSVNLRYVSGAHANSCYHKKVCDENRKKER